MLYLVKQSAWEAAGFDGNPKPQPVVEVIKSGPRAGCVMLAFPYHWWQPDEVEEAGEEDNPRIRFSATETVKALADLLNNDPVPFFGRPSEVATKITESEFSKLDGAYRCPLHQKSGDWPDNPCPVCASNALKLDLPPLDTPSDAPRLEGAWTCEIEKTAPAVVGLPDNGGEE
jgi:hypothetical protein